MKATGTGIVRRIDDLGRIVIPKEIRHTLGISEGDSLELFYAGGGVAFFPHDTSKDVLECIYKCKKTLSECDSSVTKELALKKVKELEQMLKEQVGGK
ncbi:hypothetical protein SDC9_194423 [bioreactor metagenome]|uniref:SpoVT-AbrB domain-containing protein n=1 Tax=bioreactor metagenome TaxID=1076179 RepID=A0A645IET7_9ZZZZ